MTIDKPSSVAGTISTMRGELRRRIGQSAASKTVFGGESTNIKDSMLHNLSDLKSELIELVDSIDINNQAAMDAIKPKVIRAILLWEFGQSLRNHSEWQTLLDRIQLGLESDSRHDNYFRDIFLELKQAK